MKIHKDINDIKFTRRKAFGEVLEISEPIVMASAAGWYVGSVYKEPECDDMIAPYSRHTPYYVATPEEAEQLLPKEDEWKN